MKIVKIILVFLSAFNVSTVLNAQELDTDGTRKTLSTELSDFSPFPGVWVAEKGNKIIELNLKLELFWIDKDALVKADKSKPNYRLLMSYKVIDKNSKKVIADSDEGEKLYDKYSFWPTVSMNMNILADPENYPLKLIKLDKLKNSYSYELMDYKNCYTHVAAKLTVLPTKPNELIWLSEIMDETNQVNDMEEDLNCTVITDNSRMTIPGVLIFKRTHQQINKSYKFIDALIN